MTIPQVINLNDQTLSLVLKKVTTKQSPKRKAGHPRKSRGTNTNIATNIAFRQRYKKIVMFL